MKKREDKGLYGFCKNVKYARNKPEARLMKLDADRIASLDALGFEWSSLIGAKSKRNIDSYNNATGQLEVSTKDAEKPHHEVEVERLSKEKHLLEMWSITRKKIGILRKELKSERDAGVIGKLEIDICLLMKRKAEYAEKMGMK